MTVTANAARYNRGEEIANSVIHGVGALLAVGGLAVLTTFASLRGDAWHIVGASVFGVTLVLLYGASTLYHSIPSPRAKRVLRTLDHAAIYLLIAGSYTPFTLVSLRGPWGWSLFGVIWGLAVLGIVSQVTVARRWEVARVALYVAMGWVGVVAARPMFATVEPGGLLLLAAGGVAYTAGIGFYASRRLPYSHAIWHLFVLAGSAFHFFAILYYVIPGA